MSPTVLISAHCIRNPSFMDLTLFKMHNHRWVRGRNKVGRDRWTKWGFFSFFPLGGHETPDEKRGDIAIESSCSLLNPLQIQITLLHYKDKYLESDFHCQAAARAVKEPPFNPQKKWRRINNLGTPWTSVTRTMPWILLAKTGLFEARWELEPPYLFYSCRTFTRHRFLTTIRPSCT